MRKINVDIVIIGGGPAGLAAAMSAHEQGISSENILILERDIELGGILNQCIHNGFGLHVFKEELTGPEYACRFIDMVREAQIPYLLETMVMEIKSERDSSHIVYAASSSEGMIEIHAKSIVLAMGCRERPRGALRIPGSRPAGIYTAGTAQRLVNIEGRMPGKNFVILGSGDIGLIMARRLTFEGAKVHCIAEIQPKSGGLQRNIAQCVEDFDIPLLLSHAVVKIHGKERLEGVTIAEVDKGFKPIEGTTKYWPCDALLLSVGLIPENEVSKTAGIKILDSTGGPEVDENLQTNVKGIFACGNVVHVHDLVDNVSKHAYIAGRSAANYVKSTNQQ